MKVFLVNIPRKGMTESCSTYIPNSLDMVYYSFLSLYAPPPHLFCHSHGRYLTDIHKFSRWKEEWNLPRVMKAKTRRETKKREEIRLTLVNWQSFGNLEHSLSVSGNRWRSVWNGDWEAAELSLSLGEPCAVECVCSRPKAWAKPGLSSNSLSLNPWGCNKGNNNNYLWILWRFNKKHMGKCPIYVLYL